MGEVLLGGEEADEAGDHADQDAHGGDEEGGGRLGSELHLVTYGFWPIQFVPGFTQEEGIELRGAIWKFPFSSRCG